MKYVTTLTIAGSDCSGGAGVQADIKTLSALGCYASSVITAITIQNTQGVSGVAKVDPCVVAAQIHAVMTDIPPFAIKIGMVNDADTLLAIADALSSYSLPPVVIDPVMVSTSGRALLQHEAVALFQQRLLPLATLLTPNLPEAELLSHIRITDDASRNEAARRILQQGCKAVLIKGGHLKGNEMTDCLYTPEGTFRFQQSRVVTPNTHGTGCTLSSAICAWLARGCTLPQAVERAKHYITQALQAGSDVKVGKGIGPLNHLFSPVPLIKQEEPAVLNDEKF